MGTHLLVKMMKLLIICALVAAASCKVIRARSCLTKSEKVNALKVKSVALEPCDSNPCTLKRGGSTELQISFTAQQDEPDFTDVCHGRVGFWVPFPLKKDHACKDPAIRVPVRWELKRSDGTRAFCVEFLTQLK